MGKDKDKNKNKFVFFNNNSDRVSCEVAEYIKTLGYTPVFIDNSVDLISEQAVNDFLEPYKGELVGAVLANPAMIHGEIEYTTDEMWNSARDIFAVAMINLTQIAGKILSQNKTGSIIYLNSIHADKPLGNGFLYSMGCAATQMLCKEAAIIYGASGVGCYNIMRGIVEGEESCFTSEYSSLYHNAELRFPQEKIPSAQSLNELCAFLLSGGGYILNGTDLHADEGFRLYYGKSSL